MIETNLPLPRLAVRIRPPLRPNDPGFELIPQRFQRSMVQTTSDTSLSIDSPQGRKLFVFDRVFSPDVMQDGIWDYLADSIDAFMQGYNVSLLAYGQSGAGKSYTMGTSGPLEQQDTDVMGKSWTPPREGSLTHRLERRTIMARKLTVVQVSYHELLPPYFRNSTPYTENPNSRMATDPLSLSSNRREALASTTPLEIGIGP